MIQAGAIFFQWRLLKMTKKRYYFYETRISTHTFPSPGSTEVKIYLKSAGKIKEGHYGLTRHGCFQPCKEGTKQIQRELVLTEMVFPRNYEAIKVGNLFGGRWDAYEQDKKQRRKQH